MCSPDGHAAVEPFDLPATWYSWSPRVERVSAATFDFSGALTNCSGQLTAVDCDLTARNERRTI